MASRVLAFRQKLLNEERVPFLTAAEREEVAQLLARLEAECGQDVRRVILYGSKARGDAVFESDIDLLIVTKDGADRVKRAVEAFEREQEHWAEPQVFSAEAYRDYQRLKLPFYVNARRDGIELWNEEAQQIEERQVPLDFTEGEFRTMDYATLETIKLYVGEARDAWREAVLVEREISPLRALHSAYYAAFNWARAALYSVNIVRGKHTGIRDALSEFLVKPNLLEEEYKDIYQRLMDARIWSDYQKVKKEHINDWTDEDARTLLRDAERFIARLERFLKERGALE
jgi:uncharacterized protein (UPF0332 family)/predicted nucleotidyltransferase